MNWDLFFTYETKIPEGMGFRIAGPEHMIWLAILALLSVLLMWLYVRLKESGRKIWEYVIAWSLVGWVIVRILYVAVIGEAIIYELPLHLCSIVGICCAIHCVTRWEWLGQVLYSIGLPGTLLALLFPNWGWYPAFHFITIESFFFHAGIVLYVVSQLYSSIIVPRVKDAWKVIVFLLAAVTPVYLIDKRYGVNYMFVNWPSAGSPLEALAAILGIPGYLAGYAGLTLLCIFVMDALYALGQLFFQNVRGQ